MASIFDFRERARARYNPPYRPPEPKPWEQLLQVLLSGLNAWQSIEGIKTQRATREGLAAAQIPEGPMPPTAAQTQTELGKLLKEKWEFGEPEAQRDYTDIPGTGEGALQRYPIEGIREPRAALRTTRPTPQLSEYADLQEMIEKRWLREPQETPWAQSPERQKIDYFQKLGLSGTGGFPPAGSQPGLTIPGPSGEDIPAPTGLYNKYMADQLGLSDDDFNTALNVWSSRQSPMFAYKGTSQQQMREIAQIATMLRSLDVISDDIKAQMAQLSPEEQQRFLTAYAKEPGMSQAVLDALQMIYGVQAPQ